jgi:hypothetical protein
MSNPQPAAPRRHIEQTPGRLAQFLTPHHEPEDHMHYQTTLGPGIAGPGLLTQMATVLDPLATTYEGQPTEVIKPILQRAWHQAFHTDLPEPVLTRCARAIRDRTPWTEELLNDGWHRTEATASTRRLPPSSTAGSPKRSAATPNQA